MDTFAVAPSRRKKVDRGFIQAGHGAERAGDEVKLVLNNQIGRIQPVPVTQRAPLARLRRAVETTIRLKTVDVAEKRSTLTHPWKSREFIDGSDQKRGQPTVDWLIDHNNG